MKGDDTAAATSVATDSHGRSTGVAQTASDFTSVTARTEARHGGLTNATGMVEPDPLTLTWYSSATQDRDISEDPMVEEFAASLVGSQIIAWPSLEHLPSTSATLQLLNETPAVAAPQLEGCHHRCLIQKLGVAEVDGRCSREGHATI